MFDNINVSLNTDEIEEGTYALHFERWLRFFPRAQIHIVNGDNFIVKPWEELEKVETFLGLPHELGQDRFIFNTDKGFYCFLGKHGEEMCMADSKGREHPPLPPALELKLKDFFRPWNYKFYNQTGVNFGWER